MNQMSYILVLLQLIAGGVLTVYAPDNLSAAITAAMLVIILAGSIYGFIPVISFTGGMRTGQRSITRASETEGSSAWVAALKNEHFFRQKTLDKLYADYCGKVRQQRETGQIVSDIDDIINDDVLGIYSWRNVIAQVPGTLTGLGILGTFVGLLLGLRDISFITVEAALGSVRSILSGMNTAFYTSIAGVVLSVIFNISNNILRNVMSRETGLFLEEFHKNIIPTTEEQERYSRRRELRQITELLDRLPRKNASGISSDVMADVFDNERILMPQILEGMDKGEFTFFLQPVYELNTRRIVGAEALVRWKHPSLGVISPSVFIPVLERNGYITKLDQYIWEKVCQTVRNWMDEDVRPLPISVNVTKTDMLAIDVVGFFESMLKKYGIPPKYINIDMAKSAYLETHSIMKDVENKLRKVGFNVVLDGFDGDYIELDSAGEIGTDMLKLDLRSGRIADNLNAIPGIFEQARKLRLNLSAEGIENMNQLTMLRKCGCTEGQGYFFSKPLSAEEFEDVIKTGQL